jgi:hypothetical protein
MRSPGQRIRPVPRDNIERVGRGEKPLWIIPELRG